ncbi:MAG: ABC transporter substrate-binding protein [Nitrospinales bacterium]
MFHRFCVSFRFFAGCGPASRARTAGARLAGVCLVGFVLCSAPISAFAEELFESKANANVFNQAEFLFHSGEFAEAKQLYQDYLQNRLDGGRAGKAFFRLGQIDFKNRYYSTALQYFDYVLDQFPRTHLTRQAQYLAGVCYFEMERFDEAEAIFKIQSRANPDAVKRWQSLLYLSRLDEKRFDYGNALVKIRQVYDSGQDKALRDQAVQAAEKIIREQLPRETLLFLVRKFRAGFPVDLMLWRLLDLYRLERDHENYQATLREFLALFPTHPRRQDAEKMLARAEEADDRLRVGVLLPLTGKHALTGQRVLQGIQLAFNQLSASEKQGLELVVKDSGFGSLLSQTVEELATDPNVVAILGPVLSRSVRDIAPLLDRYEIPLFTPTASAADLPALSPYIFRNALTRKIQGKFLADYAVNKLNLRRFVIFSPTETFGEEFKDIFSREVLGLGAEVVAWVTYNRSQNDFKNQILDIGGISDRVLKRLTLKQLAKTEKEDKKFQGKVPFSKPLVEQAFLNSESVEGLKVSLELSYDAIFIPGFYDKVGLIAPQLVFYNINEVTLLGTNGWNYPDLVKTAGPYLRNKGVFVDGFFVHSREGRVREFVESFQANFGEEPTILSAQAFDAGRILFQLIDEGARTRTALKNQLQSVENFPGVSGNTTILPSGDSEKKLFPLKIKGKKIVQVD